MAHEKPSPIPSSPPNGTTWEVPFLRGLSRGMAPEEVREAYCLVREMADELAAVKAFNERVLSENPDAADRQTIRLLIEQNVAALAVLNHSVIPKLAEAEVATQATETARLNAAAAASKLAAMRAKHPSLWAAVMTPEVGKYAVRAGASILFAVVSYIVAWLVGAPIPMPTQAPAPPLEITETVEPAPASTVPTTPNPALTVPGPSPAP